jgi:hypothetical protein
MRLLQQQRPLPLRLLLRVLLRLRPLLVPNLQMLPVYAMTALMRRPRARVPGVVDTKG